MPTKVKNPKELARAFESLSRAGIKLEDLAAVVREAESKGLLPKIEDPLREKVKKWALESGVMDEIISQYSDSWSFSVTIKDGWSIQFVNRRRLGEARKDHDAHKDSRV